MTYDSSMVSVSPPLCVRDLLALLQYLVDQGVRAMACLRFLLLPSWIEACSDVTGRACLLSFLSAHRYSLSKSACCSFCRDPAFGIALLISIFSSHFTAGWFVFEAWILWLMKQEECSKQDRLPIRALFAAQTLLWCFCRLSERAGCV